MISACRGLDCFPEHRSHAQFRSKNDLHTLGYTPGLGSRRLDGLASSQCHPQPPVTVQLGLAEKS